VGHGFWQERFGADPELLGRTLRLNGELYEIIGVAPEGFGFPANAQLWVPYYIDVEDCGRGCRLLEVVGRLADGTSVETARSELTALGSRLEAAYPEDNYGRGFGVATLEDEIVGDVRTGLLVLLAAVGIVLLIACANVANLLLARANARAGEIAVRSALGASRLRIVGQLLLEALVLAGLGGALGTLMASFAFDALLWLAPATIPRLDDVAVDGTVLSFALGTSLLTLLLFALAPALRLASVPVAALLSHSGRGRSDGPAHDRSRSALLVAQMALSLTLLSGAGLLLRSLSELRSIELGFDHEGVLTFDLWLPDAPYVSDADRAARFFTDLEERIVALPGVESVGSIFGSPLSGDGATTSVRYLDRPAPPEGQEEAAVLRVTTPGFHETLEIPLLRGRALEKRDRADAPRVALVSRSLADRYYPNQDPIGKQIQLGMSFGYAETPRTIVGVVSDIRSVRLTRAPMPEVYVPQSQMGSVYMTVTVRSTSSTADLLPGIRREVETLDPDVPIRDVEMLETTVERSFGSARFYLTLLTIFAGIAVMLAAVGLYGVVAYLVARRTREIGIRMALGATRGAVVRMVVAQGLRPAAAGVVLGLAGAYLGSRILRSLLYNVEPGDPVTLAGVTALLLVIVVAAIIVPARQAIKIPPAAALRAE
jgi:predicted permease